MRIICDRLYTNFDQTLSHAYFHSLAYYENIYEEIKFLFISVQLLLIGDW